MTNQIIKKEINEESNLTEILVFLTTKNELSQIPEEMKEEMIQNAWDIFMAYVDDYFEHWGYKREATRLKYAKQTKQSVLSNMPGFAEKIQEALLSFVQSWGYKLV